MLVDPESLRKIYRFSECPREQSGNVLTSAWKRRWLDKAGSEDVPSMSRICQRSIPVYDDSWWKKTHGSAEHPSNKLHLVCVHSFALLVALQICEMKHIGLHRNSESF